MAGLAKHRHSAEGGYQRGEETRARIVTTALKLFGERGYDGTSTREIAASAGVNAPALQYYFDGKEGLYIACVEHIVARVWEYLSDVTERAQQVLARPKASDAELIEAFCAMQAQFAEFMFTSTDKDDWRLFMARQQAGGGPAAGFQLAYKGINARVTPVIASLVGRLLGRAADDEETVIRTAALQGQLTIFHISRRNVLKTLGWDAINAERLALIKRLIREQTEAMLRSFVQMRDAARRTPASVVTRKKTAGTRQGASAKQS
ncbi:MAG: CerR family C-terminal domain-containing protein [Steroidobacteraceae bacterium]